MENIRFCDLVVGDKLYINVYGITKQTEIKWLRRNTVELIIATKEGNFQHIELSDIEKDILVNYYDEYNTTYVATSLDRLLLECENNV